MLPILGSLSEGPLTIPMLSSQIIFTYSLFQLVAEFGFGLTEMLQGTEGIYGLFQFQHELADSFNLKPYSCFFINKSVANYATVIKKPLICSLTGTKLSLLYIFYDFSL
jgi:hypothetical protein